MSKQLKNFRLDVSTELLIDDLKEKLSLDSNTDVLRKAINLLNAVSKNQEQGGELILTNSNGERRCVVFI